MFFCESTADLLRIYCGPTVYRPFFADHSTGSTIYPRHTVYLLFKVCSPDAQVSRWDSSYKHWKGPKRTDKTPKRPTYNDTEWIHAHTQYRKEDNISFFPSDLGWCSVQLYIVNIVKSMQIRYWNCVSNIGTTVDQRWHNNVVNVGMPIQILGWANSSCKLGMYGLYNHIIVYHQQQPNSQLEQRLQHDLNYDILCFLCCFGSRRSYFFCLIKLVLINGKCEERIIRKHNMSVARSRFWWYA